LLARSAGLLARGRGAAPLIAILQVPNSAAARKVRSAVGHGAGSLRLALGGRSGNLAGIVAARAKLVSSNT
jgi:hypothetical protein